MVPATSFVPIFHETALKMPLICWGVKKLGGKHNAIPYQFLLIMHKCQSDGIHGQSRGRSQPISVWGRILVCDQRKKKTIWTKVLIRRETWMRRKIKPHNDEWPRDPLINERVRTIPSFLAGNVSILILVLWNFFCKDRSRSIWWRKPVSLVFYFSRN